ncbi:hypothetical protein E2C01_067435 [Portunus trituberculatus]|uniref:Uncharacterized protein n=1 Tax=Portunus trituberculatus TaxID=210409 RepID=A0A5B7HV11_PORTR|nr:hypothetical protein [Portunus trituberculatus]
MNYHVVKIFLFFSKVHLLLIRFKGFGDIVMSACPLLDQISCRPRRVSLTCRTRTASPPAVIDPSPRGGEGCLFWGVCIMGERIRGHGGSVVCVWVHVRKCASVHVLLCFKRIKVVPGKTPHLKESVVMAHKQEGCVRC